MNSGATLNVQGPVTGSYNVTKGLGGTLIFSAPVYDTTTTNWLCLNSGVVQLNAGNATLLPGIGVGSRRRRLGPQRQRPGLRQPHRRLQRAYLSNGGIVISSSGTGDLVVVQRTQHFTFPGQITGARACQGRRQHD